MSSHIVNRYWTIVLQCQLHLFFECLKLSVLVIFLKHVLSEVETCLSNCILITFYELSLDKAQPVRVV